MPTPLACLIALVLAGGADPPPLVLENAHVRLTFDGRTGAWTGLVDRATGADLVAAPGPALGYVPPTLPSADAVTRAIAAGRAVDLAGAWGYTPAPERPGEAADILAGRLDPARWRPTPVPSVPGAEGDNQLAGRVGDFWYRRTFATPAGLPDDEPAVLVLGAVDDFDATYLNGTPIGATGPETPHHWETPRRYPVAASILRRDGPNELLVRVANPAFNGGIAGPVVLGAARDLTPEPDAGPAVAVASSLTSEGVAELSMEVAAGGLTYRESWSLAPDEARIWRRVRIRNASDAEVVLERPPVYATPAFRLGPATTVSFPGTLPVGDVAIESIDPAQELTPRSRDPLVVLRDASAARALGSWFHDETEYAPVAVGRRGEGLALRHAQEIVMRLAPGAGVELGTQAFWLAHGPRDAALRGVQAEYARIGLRAPDGAPPGLRSAVVYCGHPGGVPENGYRGFGGFAAMEAYLPTLDALNVDTLWFLPIWDHGTDPRWNLYAPFDPMTVSPLYGTPEELKHLSDAAGARGIRLLFDLVPHGPPDFTPLAKEHPDWISRQRDGSPQYAWNQVAFDYAHPGVQELWGRAAAWGARAFGAAGARVDCGAESPLNWNPEAGARPSRSTLAGALALNRAIREGYLRANGGAILLPEEYTGASIFARVADLTYDAQLYFLLADLHERGASPEEWAATLQAFLHDQRLTLPPGSLKMRWISNHDTVSWTFQKARPLALYGAAKTRALLALCALIDGVPMLYQGDEAPRIWGGDGPSNVDFLGRIYALRKTEPALRDGRADTATVRASGGVFACLREADGRRALVLVSLNPEPVASAVEGTSSGSWTDVLDPGSPPLTAPGPVPLAPFQVRVLTPIAPD